jgi:hypothetical protein
MNAVYEAYNSYFNNDTSHNNPYAWPMDNGWTGLKHGMDVDTPVRFIKRISLYTLSRQRYQEYRLLGPRIKSWKHGDVDYSAGAEVIESSMTVEFEGVSYSSGEVSEGTPDGFASIHYDTVQSPLDTGAGGNANTIFNTPPTDPLSSTPSFLSNSIAAQRENLSIDLPTGQLPTDDLFSPISNLNFDFGPIDDPENNNVVAGIKFVNQQTDESAFPVQFGGGTSQAPTINTA